MINLQRAGISREPVQIDSPPTKASHIEPSPTVLYGWLLLGCPEFYITNV